jgi:transmembrane 9 superfamily protein 3
VICSQVLTEKDTEKFNQAVSGGYFYQMYFDDLPVWGMVGEGRAGTNYIFTKRQLSVSYNGDRIIEVNMTSDGLEPIEVGHELSFSLTVVWKQTGKPFHNR